MQAQRLVFIPLVGVLGVEAASIGVEVSGAEEDHAEVCIPLFATEEVGGSGQCRVSSDQRRF